MLFLRVYLALPFVVSVTLSLKGVLLFFRAFIIVFYLFSSMICPGCELGSRLLFCSRLFLSWSLSPSNWGRVSCPKEGRGVRRDEKWITIGRRGRWGECAMLASSFPGTSADSLPSRIMANLTPDVGGGGPVVGGGARQVHTFCKNTIHTYLQDAKWGVWFNAPVRSAVALAHQPVKVGAEYTRRWRNIDEIRGLVDGGGAGF